MDIKVRIGLRIKELRTEKNLTQEAVAFKADIDRTFMNHIENAKRSISITTLEKVVCHGLEMDLTDFFNTASFTTKKKGGQL
jgi:transcriptional regulator with XRE-family HTH domain